jgi:RNase P/RNase MRP subunit p30
MKRKSDLSEGRLTRVEAVRVISALLEKVNRDACTNEELDAILVSIADAIDEWKARLSEN